METEADKFMMVASLFLFAWYASDIKAWWRAPPKFWKWRISPWEVIDLGDLWLE